jgi:hypothetical protein
MLKAYLIVGALHFACPRQTTRWPSNHDVTLDETMFGEVGELVCRSRRKTKDILLCLFFFATSTMSTQCSDTMMLKRKKVMIVT